ncbi:MAG: thioredoxin-like domain-containing protein [Bacteroidota bacterium]
MKKFFPLILLMIAVSAFAQPKDGYSIKVTFKPFKNQFIYLGYYYGNQYPIVDSVKLNEKSEGVFKGDKKLSGGIYLIGYPDKSKFFEFLIDKEQFFSITADSVDVVHSLKFENSSENVLFNNYQLYMLTKGKEIEKASSQLFSAKDKKDSAKLNDIITANNKQIKEYREDVMKKNPKSFLTTLLVAMQEPEIPTADKQPGGKYDSLYVYRYFKNHYWDGVNFYDERLARTTFFDGKIDKYFAQLVYPDADSVNKEIDWMMGYASVSPEMKKFLLLKFTNRYITQKYMWEDKVFVHIYEKYFSNQKYDWMNEKGYQLVSNRAYSLMANILGTSASNVILPDTANQTVSLFAVNAPYTLVVFWDPTCGHCRETLPKVDSIYRAGWKDLGLKIFAIGRETEGTRKDWINYIRQHHLEDWTNVFYSKAAENERINQNTPGYSQLYDIQSFPTLYLLDSEKRIIAKKLSYEQMNEVLKQKAGVK